MNKICFGCGIKLQSTDKEKLGYVPEKKLESSKYCMRCFRMMHYGEVRLEETPKDKKEIINKINKDNKFVIFLVDFLNINDNTMDLYKSIKRDKILVINKCELLPKHVKRENIKKFIIEYYHVNGEIRIKGGNNSHGATSILNYLEKNNIKETYIVGMTNAGKSTLINDLIKATNTDISKINVRDYYKKDIIAIGKILLNCNTDELIDIAKYMYISKYRDKNYMNDNAYRLVKKINRNRNN